MRWTGLALTAGALMLAATAGAAPKSRAENGLIGIKLYDSGTRVVSVYGTPDQIEAVSVGGATTGNGNGFGGGSGSPSGFGPGGKGGGGSPGRAGAPGAAGAPSPGPAGRDMMSPFNFADSMLQMGAAGAPSPGPSMGGEGGPGGPPSGFPGAAPGGGAPRGGGGSADVATYTRWVYNRGGSKYGFVIDKFGRVVQIEAIGLQNNKVRTSRGIGFGATFAQIIKKYQAPDGYEISGDNVLVKFLSKSKVAFRLSRLGEKKPQVVTGIVVAAAKG